MKKNAIIVDLDGTLCNNDHRRHFVENGNRRWTDFYMHMSEDSLNSWCAKIIHHFEKDHKIIFVTGRPEDYGGQTLSWLIEKGFDGTKVFMRKNGDSRKDCIVKEEIYITHIEPEYNVVFCIDDRKQVVDMWRSLGLVCLQCAEGNF